MPGETSDGALVTRVRAGDLGAADELAGRHADRAWRAALAVTGRRDLADDALQDGFERAFRALDDFDVTRPFGPWLNRIVINRALSLVQRARPTQELTEELHPVEDGRLETNAEVIDALAHLSPERRTVVVLRVVLGFTPEECAQALEVPVGTVHSRLHRALAELRGVLEVPST